MLKFPACESNSAQYANDPISCKNNYLDQTRKIRPRKGGTLQVKRDLIFHYTGIRGPAALFFLRLSQDILEVLLNCIPWPKLTHSKFHRLYSTLLALGLRLWNNLPPYTILLTPVQSQLAPARSTALRSKSQTCIPSCSLHPSAKTVAPLIPMAIPRTRLACTWAGSKTCCFRVLGRRSRSLLASPLRIRAT